LVRNRKIWEVTEIGFCHRQEGAVVWLLCIRLEDEALTARRKTREDAGWGAKP
jgi:hypothetical protein